MGNYDSDSSDGGDQDFTETNVLLGYASKEASESDDVNSYIGGRPVRTPMRQKSPCSTIYCSDNIEFSNFYPADMVRPHHSTIRRSREVQSMQRYDGSAFTAEWGLAKRISGPREAPVRRILPSENVQAQRRQHPCLARPSFQRSFSQRCPKRKHETNTKTYAAGPRKGSLEHHVW
jgi:hypothetical protein